MLGYERRIQGLASAQGTRMAIAGLTLLLVGGVLGGVAASAIRQDATAPAAVTRPQAPGAGAVMDRSTTTAGEQYRSWYTREDHAQPAAGGVMEGATTTAGDQYRAWYSRVDHDPTARGAPRHHR